MKRKLITLLAIVTLITLMMPVKANAAAFEWFSVKIDNKIAPALPIVQEQPKPEPVKVQLVKVPDPVVYTVIAGDNLSKIGTAYNVEWQRLWAKNTQLSNPDLIHIGDQITIPEPSEQLERAIPVVVALPAATPGVAPRMSFDGGNGYDYGYCTWYVKTRRGASLPNNLGNANTWYSRAAAGGMTVGSAPRAGAVGATTAGALGHVVYVESVNADGSINISEMNYAGWGIQSSRTTSASEFVYIY